mmetsp:Transcript_69193/g.218897  ORF Transcript_69193/g.218897 Transcript_69193/m.218897 type:complete len:223 (+) Transcript_69193:518-1186(+)
MEGAILTMAWRARGLPKPHRRRVSPGCPRPWPNLAPRPLPRRQSGRSRQLPGRQSWRARARRGGQVAGRRMWGQGRVTPCPRCTGKTAASTLTWRGCWPSSTSSSPLPSSASASLLPSSTSVTSSGPPRLALARRLPSASRSSRPCTWSGWRGKRLWGCGRSSCAPPASWQCRCPTCWPRWARSWRCGWCPSSAASPSRSSSASSARCHRWWWPPRGGCGTS